MNLISRNTRSQLLIRLDRAFVLLFDRVLGCLSFLFFCLLLHQLILFLLLSSSSGCSLLLPSPFGFLVGALLLAYHQLLKLFLQTFQVVLTGRKCDFIALRLTLLARDLTRLRR